MRKRAEEAGRLMDLALVRRERDPEGVALVFSRTEGVEAAVRDLVRREQECCPFFEFAVEARGQELELRASAPPDARGLLDELFGLGSPAS
jgi:hypothetical protein